MLEETLALIHQNKKSFTVVFSAIQESVACIPRVTQRSNCSQVGCAQAIAECIPAAISRESRDRQERRTCLKKKERSCGVLRLSLKV